MKEETLYKYFKGQLSETELSKDLKNSQIRTGYDTTNFYVNPKDTGHFKIEIKHLIMLCDAYLNKIISAKDLSTIGFALMGSDFFKWNTNSKSGKIIDEVISGWDNCEISYDITDKNVWHWRQYLDLGYNNLDKNELKLKSRSKGKFLNLYRQIDIILEKEWDPIGVSDIIRDEYQMYVSQIFQMTQKNASANEIEQALYIIETVRMGCFGNRENCQRVSKMIAELEINSDT